eukprot:m.678614 g.678614  ORF g.678614 m.678614 type:complete len:100 (-) comp22807_c0_seq3:2453-2752(-)
MGDFDPCECFFSHNGMMTRLLRMLQDAQDACTDGECNDGLLDDPTNTGGVGTATIVAAWMAVAAGLYMMRPRGNGVDGKPAPGSNGGHGRDPEPPAPTA